MRYTMLEMVATCILLVTDVGAYRYKVGTSDLDSATVRALPYARYSKNKKFRRELRDLIWPHVLPPRRLSYMETINSDFGLLMVQFETTLINGYDLDELLEPLGRAKKIMQWKFAYRKSFPDEFMWDKKWLDAPPDSPGGSAFDNANSKRSDGGTVNAGPASERSKLERRSGDKDKVVETARSYLDLSVISQPPDVSLDEINDREQPYHHYKDSGQGQVVYVLDSGMDLSHPEFADLPVEPEWLWVGHFHADKEPLHSHGTSVISKIVGKWTGVARNAQVVVVNLVDGSGDASQNLGIDALSRVYDHIKKENSAKNCIINLSWQWYLKRWQKFAVDMARIEEKLLMAMLDLGNVIVVAAAGNRELKRGDLPAYLATKADWKKFVVAGGYNPYSGQQLHGRAPFIRVSAPSELVMAATTPLESERLYRDGKIDLEQRAWQLCFVDGTSFATPMVAGQIAAWLGAGIYTIDNVVENMYRLAYSRVDDGPPALWNGITKDKWPSKAPSW
ncbi:hypothetical protein ABW21_db0203444 [Orbilia brochopaga]|nr:hypothetical protein ABW21_db0203444 [Drechslerella brochopaga]